jgi:glucan phosphoethanolaminetransferase (alkaline phosphatase superfamily)
MVKSDHLIELRFTRSRQAVVMMAWGLAFWLVAAGLGATYYHNFYRQAWWWVLLPAVPALIFSWLAYCHLRHPYLALTRVGLEIYPFFRPSRNMHLVLWQQIARTEVTAHPATLTLTRADQADGKIFITLEPIHPRQRQLLTRALEGVQAMREKVSAENAV